MMMGMIGLPRCGGDLGTPAVMKAAQKGSIRNTKRTRRRKRRQRRKRKRGKESEIVKRRSQQRPKVRY